MAGGAGRPRPGARDVQRPGCLLGHRSAVSTRKGGGFYGYTIDAMVCTATDLPIAWNVRTAREAEQAHTLPLIDTAKARGFAVETCAMDKGYDARHIYEGCEGRDVPPIIPLIQTTGVKRGDHHTPTCEHGAWRFAGADYGRKATKCRCPSGRVQARLSLDRGRAYVPAHPARDTPLDRSLPPPRSRRARVRPLEADWALAPLRVRGLDRVRLHADLTILAKLACTLPRTRAVPSRLRESRSRRRCRSLRPADPRRPDPGWTACADALPDSGANRLSVGA